MKELAYQSKLLDEVDEDIERETEKLNTVMKNVGRLLKTSDKSQLYATSLPVLLQTSQ